MNPIPKTIIIQSQDPRHSANGMIPAQFYGCAPEGLRDATGRTLFLAPNLESFSDGFKGGSDGRCGDRGDAFSHRFFLLSD
jgi:hypothetical protein